MTPTENICKDVAKVTRSMRRHGNKVNSLMTHDTELIKRMCEFLGVELVPRKTVGERLLNEILKRY